MITGVDPVTDDSATSPGDKPPARDAKGKKSPGATPSRGSGDSRNARGSGDSR